MTAAGVRGASILQWLLSLVAFLLLLVLGSFLFWVWAYPDAIRSRLTLPDDRRVVTTGRQVPITLTTNAGYVADPVLLVDGRPAAVSFSSASRPWRVVATWDPPDVTRPYTLTAQFETFAGATVVSPPLPIDVVPAGRIAYVGTTRDGAQAVYVIRTDGSARRLWARDAQAPAWGADSALYFLRNATVWRQQEADSPAEPVSTNRSIRVAAFALGPELALVDVAGRLWLHDESGAATELRIGAGAVVDATWAPDGDALILSVDDGSNLDLYHHSLESGTTTRLTQDPADDWQPAWRPGREELLFTSDRREGIPQVYWMSLDPKTEPSFVTDAPQGATRAAWNPTGDWFVSSLQREADPASRELVLQPFRGEYAVQVTRTAGSVGQPAWHTDP